jgi:hypothetical protein
MTKTTGIIAIVLISVLLLGAGIFAQTIKSGKLDLSERVFDFGLVPQESRLIHNFLLKNIGEDVLNILEVKPNCGCTAAPVQKRKLEVGDSTIMEVTFKSGKRTGNQEKHVDLTTDMQPRGLFKVKIKAWVETPTQKTPDITAEPRSIEYTPPDMKNEGSAKIQIQNNSEMDYQLSIVGFSEELGQPKLKSDKLKAGQKTELVYEFKALESLKILYGSVTLNAKSAETDFNYSIPITRLRPEKTN